LINLILLIFAAFNKYFFKVNHSLVHKGCSHAQNKYAGHDKVQLNNVDKDELVKKINELDESQIRNLNFDRDEVRKALNNTDIEGLKKMLGEHGDEIIKKINDIIG
jgi:hypothetical protein